MPVYEYACADHGAFQDLRPFAQSDAPADCPTCRAVCARIPSLPRLALVSAGTAKAHARNERSRHEPLKHRGRLDEHPVFKGKAGRGHTCTAACTHGSAAPAAPTFQSYAGPRPWVIEHGQGATTT